MLSMSGYKNFYAIARLLQAILIIKQNIYRIVNPVVEGMYRQCPEEHFKRRWNDQRMTIIKCLRKLVIDFTGKNNGSVTVEASLVLPIFIFAMLSVYSMAGSMKTKAVIYEAFMETGEYLGEYQYLYGRGDGQNAINIGAAALKFRDYLDDKENVDSYVLGGRSGIVFIRAYYDESDGYVYMDCAYDLKVDVPLFGSVNIPVTESLRQKAYVGRLVDEEAGNEQDPYVYIAENGTVCHKSRHCTYIKLSIREASLESVKGAYSPCELCVKRSGGRQTVYVTDYGDRYHNSLACSGLKRTVYRVKKSETELPYCSKCGG